VLDIPVLFGRDVSWSDTAAAEYPIVIGSDLARKMWGDANPIGRELQSPGLQGLSQDSMSMTVVGVYDATHQLPGMRFMGATARTNSPYRAYTAHGKHWRRDQILVRTRAVAEPFLPTLQEYFREIAPSIPVTSMRTLEQIDNQEYLITVRVAMLAGAGGALALLLASLGLYGVVSLAVQQRTREIGIRLAVGANPTRVTRMFLASGVRVSVVALLLGLPLSVAGLKIALSQAVIIAPGVNAYIIGVVIAVVLLLVATAATWLPARRASQLYPAMTLRAQ
jgi:putative ABC transport system permease protein